MMFHLIWKLLPGPWPLRALCAALMVAIIVVVLFSWVFPAVAPYVPVDGTVSVPGA